jgi:hypothetical protein
MRFMGNAGAAHKVKQHDAILAPRKRHEEAFGLASQRRSLKRLDPVDNNLFPVLE